MMLRSFITQSTLTLCLLVFVISFTSEAGTVLKFSYTKEIEHYLAFLNSRKDSGGSLNMLYQESFTAGAELGFDNRQKNQTTGTRQIGLLTNVRSLNWQSSLNSNISGKANFMPTLGFFYEKRIWFFNLKIIPAYGTHAFLTRMLSSGTNSIPDIIKVETVKTPQISVRLEVPFFSSSASSMFTNSKSKPFFENFFIFAQIDKYFLKAAFAATDRTCLSVNAARRNFR